MADTYPDPVVIPSGMPNLFVNPGAEEDASGVIPFYDWIPDNEGDEQPPLPDDSSIIVTRSTDTVHSGTASFHVNKNLFVDRAYKCGVKIDMDGLEIGLGCVIDYWLYLPTGSGGDPAEDTLGLQPMPWIIDPILPGPEDVDEVDQRRVSFTMRAAPPIIENEWLHQQVTFYPTSTNLEFRLNITYNDVFHGPQEFYLDDVIIGQDESFGRADDGSGDTDDDEDDGDDPDIDIKPPVPTVQCALDPRSTLTPVMLISGYNLFSDVRSYFWLNQFRADGTPRPATDTLGTFEHEYTDYDDILAGYTQVTSVTRTDNSTRETINVQYAYPVPIQDGTFGIMDIDAPLDTSFYYTVTLNTNDPTDPVKIMIASPCSIDSSLFAPEYSGCSAALISDPLVPSYAQWFGLTSIDALSWPGRRELFEIISRAFPVAQADIRLTARTTIRGITRSLTERTKWLQIMSTGRVLRLRIPDPQYPESNWYISVGALTENRLFPDHRRPERRWELEVAVVERPVGTVNNWDYTRTYATLRDFEDDGVTPINPKTYQHVKEKYTDYLAVLYGKTYSADNAGLPDGLVYGDGRWPTVQAVETSINWLPEVPA